MAVGATADLLLQPPTALPAGLRAWPSTFPASSHWPAWQAVFFLQMPQADTGGR